MCHVTLTSVTVIVIIILIYSEFHRPIGMLHFTRCTKTFRINIIILYFY
jgi:hypothetical protein